mmetsp:Transcript_15010/g.41132  ORF Transcript_15010/g.41132 Transcript_15010/m.41132 type:complete len:172 (-) Transcript_15010:113-628(-)
MLSPMVALSRALPPARRRLAAALQGHCGGCHASLPSTAPPRLHAAALPLQLRQAVTRAGKPRPEPPAEHTAVRKLLASGRNPQEVLPELRELLDSFTDKQVRDTNKACYIKEWLKKQEQAAGVKQAQALYDYIEDRIAQLYGEGVARQRVVHKQDDNDPEVSCRLKWGPGM